MNLILILEIYTYTNRPTYEEAHSVENAGHLKIDCALLLHARHSFLTIIDGEWSAIKQMTIAGRDVYS
jgi:hypothetical protein